MASLPLSVVLITRDAAGTLERCLRSVQELAAEIVVVDSESCDGTVMVAQRHGARVLVRPWEGFGLQKQFAVAQAQHDWVLCLDADEWLDRTLVQSIQMLFRDGAPAPGAYRVTRCNRFMGRWLRHGEGYPDGQLRLFHRACAGWSADPVHEHVVSHVPVQRLIGDLWHDSGETIESYLAKQNRYTTLQARHLIDSNRGTGPIGWGSIVLRPLWRFIRFYWLRLGFLDGVPGLVHILIGCHNSSMKYAKAYMLQSQEKHPP
jgi:glycosyltransferase involved in cell wall biosynthesis